MNTEQAIRGPTAAAKAAAAAAIKINSDHSRMEWPRATILSFIDDYRRQRILWDPNTKGYHVKQTKFEALQELSVKYGTEIRAIRSKIKSLRSSFHREHGKVIAGRRKGVHYQPMWFAYEAIRFILEDETRSTMGLQQRVRPNGDTTIDCIVKKEMCKKDGEGQFHHGDTDNDNDNNNNNENSMQHANGEAHASDDNKSMISMTPLLTAKLDMFDDDRCEGVTNTLLNDLAAGPAQSTPTLFNSVTANNNYNYNNNNNTNNTTTTTKINLHKMGNASGAAGSASSLMATVDALREKAAAAAAAAVAAMAAAAKTTTPTNIEAPAFTCKLVDNSDNSNSCQDKFYSNGNCTNRTSTSTNSNSTGNGNDNKTNYQNLEEAATINFCTRINASAAQPTATANNNANNNATTSKSLIVPTHELTSCLSGRSGGISDADGIIDGQELTHSDIDNDQYQQYYSISADDVKTEIIESEVGGEYIVGVGGSCDSGDFFGPSSMSKATGEQQNATLNTRNGRKRKFDVGQQQKQQPQQQQQQPLQQQQQQQQQSEHLEVAKNLPHQAKKRPGDMRQTMLDDDDDQQQVSAIPKRTTAELDEYGVFGEYVGLTIRKLNTTKSKIAVKHLINNLLYEAEMGDYDDGISAANDPPQLYRMGC